jgi:DNA-binding CsgD family transcriptional regulator
MDMELQEKVSKTQSLQSLAETLESLETPKFESTLPFWLHSCVPYDNIAILAYYQDSASVLMSQSENPKVHADLANEYINGLYLLDPLHELHTANAARGVYRLKDVAPDKFHLNQYFIDYYRSTTMIDEIAFVSYPSPGVSIQVCLGRDSTSNQKFSSKLLVNAHNIAPVVSVLVERHWQNLNTNGDYLEAITTAKLVLAVKETHEISLTPRQAEVAMLILRGHSTISIALKLEISPQTVKVFRKQLYKKCLISSQAELFNMMLPLLSMKKIRV